MEPGPGQRVSRRTPSLKKAPMKYLFLLAATLWGSAALAGPLEDLERFRQSEAGLSMAFVQTLRAADGAVLERQEGRLEILPPNRFVWKYLSPYAAEFGSNGVLLWHWDQDLAQITVRDAQASVRGTPLAILLDRENALPVEATSEGWLRWLPQGESAQFAQMRLRMNARAPERIELVDVLDQRTDIVFTDLRMPDPKVDPRYPDVGADTLVVDERSR